jgi:hypothetical protein
MFEKIVMSFSRRSPRLTLRIANAELPACDGAVPAEAVRAVATEAALVASVDASPGALVSLWAQDRDLHPERCGPRRRAR